MSVLFKIYKFGCLALAFLTMQAVVDAERERERAFDGERVGLIKCRAVRFALGALSDL